MWRNPQVKDLVYLGLFLLLCLLIFEWLFVFKTWDKSQKKIQDDILLAVASVALGAVKTPHSLSNFFGILKCQVLVHV